MNIDRNISCKRITESVAMMMIGDAALALFDTQRHVRLWLDGPKFWRKAVLPFSERPGMTRALAVLGLGMGFWLAARQKPPAGRKFVSLFRRTG